MTLDRVIPQPRPEPPTFALPFTKYQLAQAVSCNLLYEWLKAYNL